MVGGGGGGIGIIAKSLIISITKKRKELVDYRENKSSYNQILHFITSLFNRKQK